MSTPTLRETLAMWHKVTKAADEFLDALTTAALQSDLLADGKFVGQTVGSALRRVTFHYWYHVGDMETHGPYRPE